jgi:hypothetical protein
MSEISPLSCLRERVRVRANAAHGTAQLGSFAGGCPAASYFSCLAKKSNQKKARPLQRPSGSLAQRIACGGCENSLRSDIRTRRPRMQYAMRGASEGCATCQHRTLNNENYENQTDVRNIHALFQAFLLEKAHGYCVVVRQK